MIYHLFKANIIHHVPNMIENILKYSHHTNTYGVSEHYFYMDFQDNIKSVNNEKNINRSVYREIFNKYKTNNFKFIRNSLNLIISLYKQNNDDQLIIHDSQTLFGSPQLFWIFLWIMGNHYRKNISFIYWSVPENKKENKNVIYSILFIIKSKVLRSFKNVITLTADDKMKIMNWHNLSNAIVAGYVYDAYTEFKVYNKRTKQNKTATNIMISHSSFMHNNHTEILDILERFKDEPVKIICPLSYGDTEYRKKVIAKGKHKFGHKFVYYDKLMSKYDYNQLLASIDIYISNAVIQTGLYVVNFCICTGKKMFLRENNFNWLESLGFYINNVSELKDITYSEFVKPLDREWVLHNERLASQIYSATPRINEWKYIYNGSE